VAAHQVSSLFPVTQNRSLVAMSAKDIIRHSMSMSDSIINAYLGDLSDAELRIRPIEGMNTIAWQLGHLIGSERYFVEQIKPGASPPLPADFDEGHGRNAFSQDDPSKLYSREKYQELWKAQRAATLAVLDSLSEADLDRKDEKFPPFAPTAGELLNMCGAHPIMHCGQFVAVRRKLGKPVVI
jgi:uncharacterized damage-inducible protein DinB